LMILTSEGLRLNFDFHSRCGEMDSEIRVQSQAASEIFTQSLHYLYATFKKMSYYLNTKSLICGAGHRLWFQASRENG
jgi:hypothetical protein